MGQEIAVKASNSILVGYHAISLAYHFSQRRMAVLVHGMGAFEHRGGSGRYSHDWDVLLHVLQVETKFLVHPLFIVAQVYDLHLSRSQNIRKDIDHGVLEIEEQKVGFGGPGKMQIYRHEPLARNRFSDPLRAYERLLGEIASLHTDLSIVQNVFRFQGNIWLWINKLADDILRVGVLGKNEESAYGLHEKLMHSIQLPSSLCQTASSQFAMVAERLRNQSSLVVSFIAQEENMISHIVAKNGAVIAAASKRDSSPMKAIAFVTMVFLPPTFVAVCHLWQCVGFHQYTWKKMIADGNRPSLACRFFH